MKGKLLKKLNEKTPEFFKKMLSKQIRKKVIENKVFKDTFKELSYFESLDSEEKDKLHLKKVKEVLIYAYENTKYYKNIFDEIKFNPYEFEDINELNNIPTIDKQFVLDNFDSLVSTEEIDNYVAYTGGSTGKPLKILLDTNSIYKEKAFVYNYWSKFGYDYNSSRIVTLRGLEFNNKIYKYNPIDNQIILNPFTLNEGNIEEYVKIINKFNPEFLHGYASAIYNLCRILNKKKIKLKVDIKSVCFVSENVDEHEKQYIEETLKCKSNIFYGHSERIVFAEYINGTYVFNDLYTHVNLLETDEANVYKIACTGLVSKKMPLINYVPDDKVISKNGNIQIYGHWDKEMLIGKNGEKISMASINFHNKVFDKIKLYQFEQFELGKLYINIVEDEKLDDVDKSKIINIMNTKLKNIMDIEIRIVKTIPLTNRGKYKKIIQHIN